MRDQAKRQKQGSGEAKQRAEPFAAAEPLVATSPGVESLTPLQLFKFMTSRISRESGGDKGLLVLVPLRLPEESDDDTVEDKDEELREGYPGHYQHRLSVRCPSHTEHICGSHHACASARAHPCLHGKQY